MKLKINKIINFSSVDGPGNRLVVFVQGCNLNCIYCHNPETIDYNQEGYMIEVDDLVNKIADAKNFISGVTFSGGECSLQYKEIIEVCKELKKHKIKIMLDTNFSMAEEVYSELSEYVEAFIVDLKAYDRNIHKRLTGEDNFQILENIERFYDKIYEVRCVIVPGYNDNEKEIASMFEFINSLDDDIKVKLIKFRPYGVRKPYDLIESSNDDLMEEYLESAKKIGLKNIYYK
ncbi:MAG: radical SAM protein [Bacillota bacterium]|nr:radical SAM protein [Bacillota bacterium]